jgi:hypothetical protein
VSVNQRALRVSMSRATLFAFPTAMHTTDDHGVGRPNQLEAAARAAIERRACRVFTDAEWATACARLLEFAGIVRAWERTAAACSRGNVEVLCQREP